MEIVSEVDGANCTKNIFRILWKVAVRHVARNDGSAKIETTAGDNRSAAKKTQEA